MRFLLLALSSISLFAINIESASAQPLKDLFEEIDRARPFRDLVEEIDRTRPRGRLLKKIFGQEDQQNNRQTNSQQSNRQRSSAGQPTPAQPRPNPNQHNRFPNHPTYRANTNRSDHENPGTGNPDYNRNWDSERAPGPLNTPSPSNTSPGKSGVEFGAKFKKPRRGTGVELTQLTRNGVAAKSEFQPGDRITKFGGLEVSDGEEIAGILEILNQGDQIEIEFVRNGKEESKIVQFGEGNFDATPAPGERGANNRASNTNSNRWSDTSRRSQDDYAGIEPPEWNSNGQVQQSERPLSVLSNLHEGSAPNSINNRANSTNEVQHLRSIIDEQRRVIQSLERQINHLHQSQQNTTNRGEGANLLPPRKN